MVGAGVWAGVAVAVRTGEGNPVGVGVCTSVGSDVGSVSAAGVRGESVVGDLVEVGVVTIVGAGSRAGNGDNVRARVGAGVNILVGVVARASV